MRKEFLKAALALIFILSGVAFNTGMTAEASSSLQQKLEDLQDKRNNNKEESAETKKEIKKLETDIHNVQKEIKRLDDKMTETSEKIIAKEEEVTETKERIKELRNRIETLEERIAERDELLKDRVRVMYQNGGSVNYLEVLMGAKSFGDFLDRVSALNTIAEQDREILEAHIRDQEALEEAKIEVEEQLQELEEALDQLEELKEKQEKQRKKKTSILGDMEEEESHLYDDLMTLEDEEELLKQQEKAAKQELEAYEKRLEEEARRSNSASTSNSVSVGDASADIPDSGGSLMKPATGRITSEYGQRWGRMHHGIDIGQGGRSNVPIAAAADGTVVQARYMNGYGNAVLISHRIDGRQVTTLYAHMSASLVSTGQRVSRGQQIGVMGNTGNSKGPHLHFEVHEGPWNGAKSNSVNPRNYLN
ncbi:murein hydrolase activator EnvC family protein [Bacillus piscicola]|uniref:murein hydrolase activator EnvC family protein n=1 Tax=Bacillus piscicola TaxID=1632684 RepID=UPI0023DD941A|nr:M23 family metallopeptidase [Bacillus piscicola]